MHILINFNDNLCKLQNFKMSETKSFYNRMNFNTMVLLSLKSLLKTCAGDKFKESIKTMCQENKKWLVSISGTIDCNLYPSISSCEYFQSKVSISIP